MPTADRTCATVLERGNGWVLAMLVPPIEAGGPARGCAPAALPRGAVAPLCAPWLSGGVGARSAPTNQRARSPRGVEQGAAFWCARLKNVHVRLAARLLPGLSHMKFCGSQTRSEARFSAPVVEFGPPRWLRSTQTR